MHGKHHHHGNSHHHHDHDHDHNHGPGHNHASPPKQVAQWQTPHLHGGQDSETPAAGEPDLDLVEQAFLEGFAAASDPTSFLRLAGVPFEEVDAAGKRLVLLRVETEGVTDVGSVTPHLGGGSFRYDVLPGRMTSRRGRLALVYFDGADLRPLSLEQAKNLAKP
jgi:hypothetical protein